MINKDSPELANFKNAIESQFTVYRARNNDNSNYEISFEFGKKFIRVVKTIHTQRSAHSFIDISNGDVYKAASWTTPAKNFVRGNISELTDRITNWTSVS